LGAALLGTGNSTYKTVFLPNLYIHIDIYCFLLLFNFLFVVGRRDSKLIAQQQGTVRYKYMIHVEFARIYTRLIPLQSRNCFSALLSLVRFSYWLDCSCHWSASPVDHTVLVPTSLLSCHLPTSKILSGQHLLSPAVGLILQLARFSLVTAEKKKHVTLT
jgi:hypothetical protein